MSSGNDPGHNISHSRNNGKAASIVIFSRKGPHE